jgi:hypothetical protein
VNSRFIGILDIVIIGGLGPVSLIGGIWVGTTQGLWAGVAFLFGLPLVALCVSIVGMALCLLASTLERKTNGRVRLGVRKRLGWIKGLATAIALILPLSVAGRSGSIDEALALGLSYLAASAALLLFGGRKQGEEPGFSMGIALTFFGWAGFAYPMLRTGEIAAPEHIAGIGVFSVAVGMCMAASPGAPFQQGPPTRLDLRRSRFGLGRPRGPEREAEPAFDPSILRSFEREISTWPVDQAKKALLIIRASIAGDADVIDDLHGDLTIGQLEAVARVVQQISGDD